MSGRLEVGDCRDVLRRFAAEGLRAQCAVTSPPYYAIRDYGTDRWEGGDSSCEHRRSNVRPDHVGSELTGRGTQDGAVAAASPYLSTCGRCGATRVRLQIGLEETPEDYVEELVGVFRLVREVLVDDGVVWLNIGDTYAASGQGGGGSFEAAGLAIKLDAENQRRKPPPGYKRKDLIGVPWMLAFALRRDGWYLRDEVVWAKPNPMPESVRDRCTKAHEKVFLLAKSERYYFDAAAIEEVATGRDPGNLNAHKHHGTPMSRTKANLVDIGPRERRNCRNVWTIAGEPYPGAHFAVMPKELARRCVLAGSRPGDVVLDPFMGSGTVARVATELGRRYLGCDLNPAYAELQADRTSGVQRLLVPPARGDVHP